MGGGKVPITNATAQDFVTEGIPNGYSWREGVRRYGRADEEFRMLDTLGILISTIMMLIVIFRAVRLDRVQAWFQTITPKDRPEQKWRTRDRVPPLNREGI